MKRYLWLIGFICLGSTVPPAYAGDDEGVTGSFEKLLGDWRGNCDAWGTAARCELSWQGGLHPSHYKVDYRIQNSESGDPIFTGKGIYRGEGEHARGYWSDSSGDIHRLLATWDDSTLKTHWGIAGEKQGRTHYQLNADGSLTVTDWVLQPAGWREFMRVDYSKP